MTTSTSLPGSRRLRALVFSLALFGGCSNPEVRPGDQGGGGSNGGGGSSGSGSGGTGAGNRGGSGGVPGFVIPDGGLQPSTPPVDASCGFQKFDLERRPAELLLILDRSGSMREPAMFLNPTSKWQDTIPAVVETVMKTATTVSWGMKLFPVDQLECNVPDGVEVAVAANNEANMLAGIMAATPQGVGTPTRQAVEKSVAHLKTVASNNPRYLVLATDGEPNCADGVESNLEDQEGAVMAVQAAAAAGFKTFVIGIATSFGDAHMTLNRMAEAGGTARTAMDARYYPVASRQELVNALGLITGQVASCVFPLDKMPPSPEDVAVSVNGTRLMRDRSHGNGWDYGADMRTIEIHGMACDQIKNATADVNITFGCPGIEIP